MSAIPLLTGQPPSLTDGLNQLIVSINNAPGGAQGAPLPVSQGGTAATTLSGIVISGGGLLATNNLSDLTSASTARTNLGLGSLSVLNSVNNGNWSGTALTAGNGGTGATTLTGYVYGNGTGTMTASTTIPNTSISGLGTMSTQAASAVAITGGTISGVSTISTTGATTLAALNVAGAVMNSAAGLLSTSPNTGSGNNVLATSPTLVTPALGAATATSINGLTLTASTGTLTIANAKTHVVSNSLTFTGTDSTSFAFPTTSDTVVTLTATQTLTNKTFTAPVLGAASATSLTFTSTSGIIGSSTNDSAATGSVGEVITSSVAAGSAVGLSSAIPANVTSISLTAGDWDVWGQIGFVTGATSVVSSAYGAVNTSSASLGLINTNPLCANVGFSVTGTSPALPLVPYRLSLASTTTVYLVAQSGFTTSTQAACGFIQARRRR